MGYIYNVGGSGVGMNTECGVGVYSSKVGQVLVIVFDICEVMTENNVPKGKNSECIFELPSPT